MFLGYVVSIHDIEMNEKKVKAIQKWPTPKPVIEIRSSHGLTNSLMDTCLKKIDFVRLIVLCVNYLLVKLIKEV
jgi:hypothetical protein